jgi:hypothetical protein
MNNNQITWQGEPLNPEDENDMRFKKCMEVINSLKPGDLTELMGEEWLETYRRQFQ